MTRVEHDRHGDARNGERLRNNLMRERRHADEHGVGAVEDISQLRRDRFGPHFAGAEHAFVADTPAERLERGGRTVPEANGVPPERQLNGGRRAARAGSEYRHLHTAYCASLSVSTSTPRPGPSGQKTRPSSKRNGVVTTSSV